MTSENFRVAAVQVRCTTDPARNTHRAVEGVKRAARIGARLVVLPERFVYPAEEAELLRRTAQAVPGELCDRLSGLARELGIILVAGSILEKAPGRRKLFNTCVVFDETGRLVAKYRKIHLFEIDTDQTGAIREDRTMLAGDKVVVASTSLGKLGLSICYDLRFPELYRALVRRGAQIILVPSAFQKSTGAAHWITLLRARAIEDQCFVMAANQCGNVSGSAFYGHSAVVDPWGKVLAEGDGRPGVVAARVDLTLLKDVRRRLPSLKTHVRMHRRCCL